jgi:hypothetical protein
MTIVLDERFGYVVHRLALGIELWDEARGRRLASAIDVLSPDGLLRHDSGLLVLTHRDEPASPVELHLDDPRRRLAPRRLLIPFPELADVLVAEEAGLELPVGVRSRRVSMFPGAAYDVAGRTTALRGRVVHGDGRPLRWARIEARLPGADPDEEPIWRAHGDDRGEFLLVVGTDGNTGDLARLSPADAMPVVRIEVTAIGPDPAAPPGPPPLEEVPLPALPDPVSPGVEPPAAYDPGLRMTRLVTLVLGRQTRDPDPYEPT